MDNRELGYLLGEELIDSMIELCDDMLAEDVRWIEEFGGFNFEITVKRL